MNVFTIFTMMVDEWSKFDLFKPRKDIDTIVKEYFPCESGSKIQSIQLIESMSYRNKLSFQVCYKSIQNLMYPLFNFRFEISRYEGKRLIIWEPVDQYNQEDSNERLSIVKQIEDVLFREETVVRI